MSHCAENKNIEFLEKVLGVIEDNEIPTEESYLRSFVEPFLSNMPIGHILILIAVCEKAMIGLKKT